MPAGPTRLQSSRYITLCAPAEGSHHEPPWKVHPGRVLLLKPPDADLGSGIHIQQPYYAMVTGVDNGAVVPDDPSAVLPVTAVVLWDKVLMALSGDVHDVPLAAEMARSMDCHEVFQSTYSAGDITRAMVLRVLSASYADMYTPMVSCMRKPGPVASADLEAPCEHSKMMLANGHLFISMVVDFLRSPDDYRRSKAAKAPGVRPELQMAVVRVNFWDPDLFDEADRSCGHKYDRLALSPHPGAVNNAEPESSQSVVHRLMSSDAEFPALDDSRLGGRQLALALVEEAIDFGHVQAMGLEVMRFCGAVKTMLRMRAGVGTVAADEAQGSSLFVPMVGMQSVYYALWKSGGLRMAEVTFSEASRTEILPPCVHGAPSAKNTERWTQKHESCAPAKWHTAVHTVVLGVASLANPEISDALGLPSHPKPFRARNGRVLWVGCAQANSCASQDKPCDCRVLIMSHFKRGVLGLKLTAVVHSEGLLGGCMEALDVLRGPEVVGTAIMPVPVLPDASMDELLLAQVCFANFFPWQCGLF